MKKPLSYTLSAFGLLWLTAMPLPAQNVTQLLADINTTTPVPDESVKSMVKMGNTIFLAIDSPITGSELWKTDGTPEGTELVRDIIVGTVGSEPQDLTPVGNRLYFTALNEAGARNLWITNGQAAGTRLLKTFPSGEPPLKLTAFNGRLIFSGFDSINGRELWESDGTVAGTKMNININPGAAASSAVSDFFNLNDEILYFTAFDPETNRELWQMDSNFVATPYIAESIFGPNSIFPGTTVEPLPNIELTFMQTLNAPPPNEFIYFVAQEENAGREIWKTDGEGSFTLMANIAPEAGSSDPTSLLVMPVAGQNYLFFVADNNTTGRELYRSDGTNAVPMRDINGSGDSLPQDLTPLSTFMFFSADAGSGRALYRTNGSTGVNDTVIMSGSTAGSNPENLTAFDAPSDTLLVFTALDDEGELALFTTTVLGPVSEPLARFGVGGTASHFTVDYGNLADPDDNRIYFLVNNSQLWVTDGDAGGGGTFPVKDFQGGSISSFAKGYAAVGSSTAFFSATTGETGEELWKTDGTEEGTELVLDIAPGTVGSEPQFITASGSKAFFSAAAQGNNRELWMSDGTALGTQIVTRTGGLEINEDSASEPQHLTDLGGILYFSAIGTTSGREPWRSDGTPEGTYLIADLVNGAGSSNPEQFVRYRGEVFFVSGSTGFGTRLRKESAPTVPIQDSLITNIEGPIDPKGLVVVGTTPANQRMYFAGSFPGRGRELWRSDGTDAGTECIDINTGNANSDPEHLTPVGNTLFFVAGTVINGVATGRELFRSTGSLATTSMVRDIVVGPGSSEPEQLTEVAGKLFFTANTPTNGRELWVSTGTTAGTVMVKDIMPGTGSSNIQGLRNVDGILVFSANDGVNGQEVWISDGTAAGTVMLENLAPQSASSDPTDFTAFAGQLLYTAADPNAGIEPRRAFIGSNIEVEQNGVTLSMNDVVSFEGIYAIKQKSTPLEFTIRNTGINTLSNIKIVIGGVNGSEFKIGTPRAKTSVIKDDFTTFNVVFTPKEGGVRQATVSIFSNDGDTNPFIVRLEANGDKDPYLSEHPVNLMRNVGESATFTATATSDVPDTLSIQWRKKSARITGATAQGPAPLETSYDIFGITLKDAGGYNIFVQGSNDKATSNSGELGVVQDNIPPLPLTAAVGGTATLRVVSAGSQLTYQWYRGDFALSNDARISGAQGKTLVIRGLVTGDTAEYTCSVSNGSESRTGGTTQLNIFTLAPEVNDIQEMPNAVVGGNYYHKILIDPNPLKSALSYSAKGLPPGLRVNAKTGEITGRPTRAGSYNFILLTARNTIGSDTSIEQGIDVFEFPTNLDGEYSATVERNSLINNNLGGRLDLKITNRGAFTGKLIMGATSIPVKGGLNIYTTAQRPDAVVELKPAARSGLPAMTLNLEFNPDTGLLTNAVDVTNTLTAGTETAEITGWRMVQKASAPAYAGYHTMGMELSAPAGTDVPQGWSYATFTVSKIGKLRFAGRTADGEKIASASVVGKDGQIAFYQPLYVKTKGSMMGALQIDTGVLPEDPSDNTLTGDLDWVRPANTSTKSRAYQDGFGLEGTPVEEPVELDAFGSAYPKPQGLILGISSAPAELDLLFDGAGIGSVANTTVTLGDKNKITLSSSVTKLKLNAAKGLFSGTISLTDKRKATFLGALIKDGDEEFGAGYFMLAQETAKTSPVLSGMVELSEAEEAPPAP